MSAEIVKLGLPMRYVGKPRMPPFDVSIPAPSRGSDAALLEAAHRLAAFREWWNGSRYGERDPSETEQTSEIQRALTFRVMLAPALTAAGVLVNFARRPS